MNNMENFEEKYIYQNCLEQLLWLFKWIAVVDKKTIEKDGINMGSNFAKFRRYPEYKVFIDYACEAEKHFSEVTDGNYHSVGTDCRMSLEGFMTYLYKNKKLQINEEFYKHTIADKTLWNETNRIKEVLGRETNPTGYELGSKIGLNGKPQKLFWLDAAITSKDFQNFFKIKNARPNPKEKKLTAEFSHYKSDKNFYSGEKALSILSMIYNLYFHCTDEEKRLSGTPRFDASLLTNTPKEFIRPLDSIETNGNKIPQNIVMKAILKGNLTEELLQENMSSINKTDVLGNTPLSLAVYNDDYDMVKILLENGADPNFYFKNKCADFVKSVNEEIKKDPNKYSSVWSDYIEAHNCIPLIIALKKDNKKIVELLLKYSAKTWEFWMDDYYTTIRIPPECSSILTCAYFYNAKKCIRYLLSIDIGDVNEKAKSGVTPLMLAVEQGLSIEKLREKGAKIDIKDNCRNSVFLHAVYNFRHDYELMESLLSWGKRDLNAESFKKLINHAGLAGCPIVYMDEDEAELFLEYGADLNTKNEMGNSCVVDVAILNPKLLPWFKSNGAILDIKSLFLSSNYLELKYKKNIVEYPKQFLSKILTSTSDFISPKDLDFTVPIENIPNISPLVDAMIFSHAKVIQMNIENGKDKENKEFLTKSQISELKNINPFFDVLSKYGMRFSSFDGIINSYNQIIEGVTEGWHVNNTGREVSNEELKSLPKQKLDISIDMTLEDVLKTVSSVKELSKKQKIALYKNYPFIKELERKGIDCNIPEEVESAYATEKLILESSGKWNEWVMSPSEIQLAVREIKNAIPYEDFKISPLDDALAAENYDVGSLYLEQGILVSDFTKILLLSVHDVSEKKLNSWKKVLVALKKRKDINFSNVLLMLCKKHPTEEFDIAKEFIDNGYNYFRFVNASWKERAILSYSNEYKNYNENIRERNDSFLKHFNETSFQDVNLRLIQNAILFGADINCKDEIGKSALDYAKENGIPKSNFIFQAKF